MGKVKLSEIVNGMESAGDETRVFLDRKSGEVVPVMDDELRHAEDEEEDEADEANVPEWQRQSRELTRAVALDDEGRFLSLPGQFEINEWEMMRDFATSREDEALAESLLNAIHGRGAFRYFKDRVHEAGVADDWYRFRDEAYRRIALEWCEHHGIEADADA